MIKIFSKLFHLLILSEVYKSYNLDIKFIRIQRLSVRNFIYNKFYPFQWEFITNTVIIFDFIIILVIYILACSCVVNNVIILNSKKKIWLHYTFSLYFGISTETKYRLTLTGSRSIYDYWTRNERIVHVKLLFLFFFLYIYLLFKDSISPQLVDC